MTGRLIGKTALVTGAASGIGAAIAAKFVAEGAHVLVTDIDGAAASRWADALGPSATPFRLDVTQPDEWTNAMAEAEARFGGLNILVNNAGIWRIGTIEDTTFEDWRRVHAVDLDSVFLGCKAALPLMAGTTAKGGRGAILNVSSISGVIASGNMAAYNSAKAAVPAPHQVGRAPLREAGLPDHLQLDPPDLRRHPADRRFHRRPRPRRSGREARPPGAFRPDRRTRRHRLGRGLPVLRRGQIRHRRRAVYRRRDFGDVSGRSATNRRSNLMSSVRLKHE